uniref:Uncharacterized protein n=1 Tax=Aegilops tauschii subsp. strangulata TaxID=200361 RepID=A0A453J3Y6_AEGTS
MQSELPCGLPEEISISSAGYCAQLTYSLDRQWLVYPFYVPPVDRVGGPGCWVYVVCVCR